MIYKSIYLAKRNPAVTPEDWPRVWRSHPRAVAKLGSVGQAIAGAIDTITYCERIREPALDGRPLALPDVSREHDGVAVVSSRSRELRNIGHDRRGQEAVIADEIRVFGRPVHEFSLVCEEIAGLNDPTARAAVIRFLRRSRDISRDAFAGRLERGHAQLAGEAAAASLAAGFGINLVTAEPPAGYEFDGVSEIWFANPEEAIRSFADPDLAPLAQDLAEFCDKDSIVTMLTEVIYRFPRETSPPAASTGATGQA